MTMTKRGTSFNNAIVEIVDNQQSCEKCGVALNLMEARDGVVPCPSCNFENKIKNMEAEK